jgi:hypothetical protein
MDYQTGLADGPVDETDAKRPAEQVGSHCIQRGLHEFEPSMLFFRTKEKVALTRHGIEQRLKPVRRDDAGYATSMYDFFEIRSAVEKSVATRALQIVDEEDWLRRHEAPVELGIRNRGEYGRKKARGDGPPGAMPFRALDNQLNAFRGKSPLRLSIINGFGTGMSDYIIGMTAWREVLRRLGRFGFREIDVEMWVRPSGYKSAREVCVADRSMDRVEVLPMPIRRFEDRDAFWDLSGLLDRPTAGKKPTIDFFLELLGVDPAGVPARDKRNRISLPLPIVKEVGDALQNLTSRYLILHPMSGDLLRNMPVDVFRRLCRMVVERLDCDVATLVPLPRMHERHLDLSAISSRGYLQYCGLVQRSVGLISVDTSVYHIADAFNVPAVVVFSTFHPKLRSAYYPRVEGLILPGMDPHRLAAREAAGNKVTAREVMQFWLDIDLDDLVRRLTDLMQSP